MTEHLWSPRISRRSVLRGGAAAALAAGLPPAAWAAGRPRGAGIANVRVSHDHYGVHIEPSVAANPRRPRQLLAACQASPTANPGSSRPTCPSTRARPGRTAPCRSRPRARPLPVTT
jgi:hypothetical protein